MTAFVVDANVMNSFQLERKMACEDVAHQALSVMFLNGHIALDEGDLCKQEWLNCAAGKHPFALETWLADKLVEQKIWLYPLGKAPSRKEMLAEGLPPDDHKWVLLAMSSSARAIVTCDIDFLDCRKKKADSKEKAKIRSKRKGPTQKWIKRCTGADVCLIEDVPGLYQEAA